MTNSDGLRDTLEVKVGESILDFLLARDLAALRAVSMVHMSWAAPNWLRLQHEYAASTANLLAIMTRSISARVLRTQVLEEYCTTQSRPWPFEVPPLVGPWSAAGGRPRYWAVYGQAIETSGAFSRQEVIGAIPSLDHNVARFNAVWLFGP